MSMGVNIPWLGGSKYHGQGIQNTMGKWINIPWAGGQNTMGSGDKISWVSGSSCHG